MLSIALISKKKREMSPPHDSEYLAKSGKLAANSSALWALKLLEVFQKHELYELAIRPNS
jgi:hypothetical protein